MTQTRRRKVMLLAALVTSAAALTAWWGVTGMYARLADAADDGRRLASTARAAESSSKDGAVINTLAEFHVFGPRGETTTTAGVNRVRANRQADERITDMMAAAILLPMLAPSSAGGALHEKRRRIMLDDAGFGVRDLKVLQQVLAELHPRLDQRRRQAKAAYDARKTLSTASTGREAAAVGDEAMARPAEVAFARLRQELSREGLIKLQRQLVHIKLNTKMVPVSTLSSRRLR